MSLSSSARCDPMTLPESGTTGYGLQFALCLSGRIHAAEWRTAGLVGLANAPAPRQPLDAPGLHRRIRLEPYVTAWEMTARRFSVRQVMAGVTVPRTPAPRIRARNIPHTSR